MLGEAAAQVEEASRELRLYREKIEFDPERLALVEERLNEIYKLKRKYGKDIAEILGYAEKIREELAMIEGEEERLAALTRELAGLRRSWPQPLRTSPPSGRRPPPNWKRLGPDPPGGGQYGEDRFLK